MLRRMSLILIFAFMVDLLAVPQSQSISFKYDGFVSANITKIISLDGQAEITPDGLLKLTGATVKQLGHAFFSHPIPFRNSAAGSALLSFSTTFDIAIVPEYSSDLAGPGTAFVISASKNLYPDSPQREMGLFLSNSENSSKRIVSVEFDTVKTIESGDIDGNHVGIDVNSLVSVRSAPAAYFTGQDGEYRNFSLGSGEQIRAWVEYSGSEKLMNVTVSPTHVKEKPHLPLLSLKLDLTRIINGSSMYVGFSSSSGVLLPSAHYVLGWSFSTDGPAQELDLSRLPELPRVGPKQRSKFLTAWMPSIVVAIFTVMVVLVFIMIRRKIKFAEEIEDWEQDYRPLRFSYKDLFRATGGFRQKELLGVGGFGAVYRGQLPTSKVRVAVKRVSSRGSSQGLREFIAEVESLGRLRHRNLVQLLGYCRRKGELLLVYDFMPNGSLDKFLFYEEQQPARGTETLNWRRRFHVIKGVASGLLYLHEGWDQVVLHRDVKSSNVLLDEEFNGRLGDFGLARLYDHGADPQTTHIMGTMGYIAPELSQTGRPATATDVFAFGAFLLEVACGRRPLGPIALPEELNSAPLPTLVEWVLEWRKRRRLAEARDPRLGDDFVMEEVELVLELGLLCSHPTASSRPSMREVVRFLDGDCPLPAFSPEVWRGSDAGEDEMWIKMESLCSDYTTGERSDFGLSSSTMVTDSFLSGGR